METKRIKLLDYQIKHITNALARSYDQIESDILDKYKATSVSDLNATDYDDIMEDIQEWTSELNFKYSRN